MKKLDKDNEFKIRKAAADDMDKVAEIAIAAWKPIYEGYLRILDEEIFASFYAGWEERKKEICSFHAACPPRSCQHAVSPRLSDR
jgi:hypothetical protein